MITRRSAISTVTLLYVCALAGCGGGEPGVPLEADAEEARVETEAGVEVPAFSEEVRTAFRPAAGPDGNAAGILKLLVPTEAVEPAAMEPMRIQVELTGLEAGPHAWAVWEGPCGTDGGGPLVPLSDLGEQEGLVAPLQVAEDGTAYAQVPVPPLRELWVDAGDYSVRVFGDADPTDPGSLVACAVL